MKYTVVELAKGVSHTVELDAVGSLVGSVICVDGLVLNVTGVNHVSNTLYGIEVGEEEKIPAGTPIYV